MQLLNHVDRDFPVPSTSSIGFPYALRAALKLLRPVKTSLPPALASTRVPGPFWPALSHAQGTFSSLAPVYTTLPVRKQHGVKSGREDNIAGYQAGIDSLQPFHLLGNERFILNLNCLLADCCWFSSSP